MKQTTWNGKEVLLVELPEGAVNPTIIQSHSYFYSPRIEHSIGGIDLPTDDDWHFAFASPLSPTEEEAGEWVEKFMIAPHGVDGWPPVKAYKTYGAICQPVANPVTSLYSRIRSEGFQYPERVVLLTKK